MTLRVFEMSAILTSCVSQVTKLLATSLTYPYLVVKSRMQAGAQKAGKYNNALHGLLTIIKDEGVGTLYNGIASKLVQSVLTAAFLFASKVRSATCEEVATAH